ncbi:MAG: hypothetical protein IJZ72_00640 [Oscillospiraceae bacterium]|nr:hypothetical protein [Oscillospiraceae bacterium]
MKKHISDMDYFKNALPICAAIALILTAASFITYKLISEHNYNERWKDYDECGLS